MKNELTTKEKKLLDLHYNLIRIIQSNIEQNANYSNKERENVLKHIANFFDPKLNYKL
jgi:hypothetical protein